MSFNGLLVMSVQLDKEYTMKFIWLWIISTFLAYICVALALPTNPQLQSTMNSLLFSAVPSQEGQILVVATAASTIFTALVGLASPFFRPTPPPRRTVQRVPPPTQPRVVVHPRPQVVPTAAVPTAPAAVRRGRTEAALEIMSFKLVAAHGGRFRIIQNENVRTQERIRPILGIMVKEPRMVGKILPLQVDLVNPLNQVVGQLSMRPVLKNGLNIITPIDREFVFSENVHRGLWKLHLWAGKIEWGVFRFTFSTEALVNLANHIGADMEMDEQALRAANQISAQFTIDDLLHMQ